MYTASLPLPEKGVSLFGKHPLSGGLHATSVGRLPIGPAGAGPVQFTIYIWFACDRSF